MCGSVGSTPTLLSQQGHVQYTWNQCMIDVPNDNTHNITVIPLCYAETYHYELVVDVLVSFISGKWGYLTLVGMPWQEDDAVSPNCILSTGLQI